MSRRINMFLFSFLIVLVFAPFFEISQSEDSSVYISALGLMPMLFNLGNENYSVIYNSVGGGEFFLLFIFPVFGLAMSVFEEISRNDKLKFWAKTACMAVSFIAFIFAVFSINEFDSYELSLGYFGTVFAYVLVFVIYIFEYLLKHSSDENDIFAPAPYRAKRKR